MGFIYSVCIFILRVAKLLLRIVMLVVFLGLIQPYIENINSYAYLDKLMQFDALINATVKIYLPTQIAGFDASRWITLMLLLICSGMITAITNVFKTKRAQHDLELLKEKLSSHPQSAIVTKMTEHFANKSTTKPKRQELLKDFAKLKKELEKTGRDLSFLAIDVVDSTGMKLDEDPTLVESDFNQYHDFIVSKFKAHGYIKASWTPDGVMACFNTTEQAVSTAKDILKSMPEFNRSVKMIRKDFHIRCGINSGFVYYDLVTPLEEFSDRVLDIAGHMQKNAPIDSLLIAKDIVQPIESYKLFQEIPQRVDGFEVCQWQHS